METLKDSKLDTGERCPIEDLIFVHALIPTDTKHYLELRLLGPLQKFDVPTAQNSCLESVKMVREDYRLEDHFCVIHLHDMKKTPFSQIQLLSFSESERSTQSPIMPSDNCHTKFVKSAQDYINFS